MRDFNHSIGVLVKAFFEGTLLHTECKACAVGNLVVAARNLTIDKNTLLWFDANGDVAEEIWSDAVWYHTDGNADTFATGYTVRELARIEKAFEGAPTGSDDYWLSVPCDDPQWMFNGLMAVVDVLAEIHGVDLSAKEQAKSLFVKSTL